jgi:hypothetical protein
MNHLTAELCVSGAWFQPIGAVYVKKLRIVEAINQVCGSD